MRFKEKAKRIIKEGGRIIAWGEEFFDYLERVRKKAERKRCDKKREG